MKQTHFWNNALTAGAIIGLLMAVSHIFERYAFSVGASLPLMIVASVEMLITSIVFVALLYLATRRYAKEVMAGQENIKYFTFRQGFIYTIIVTALVGIIVGLADYIYISKIIGYDAYINGYLKTMRALLNIAPNPNTSAMFGTISKQLASAPEPGLFSVIFGYIQIYMLFIGTPIGIVIGLLTKRNPVLFDNSQNGEHNE